MWILIIIIEYNTKFMKCSNMLESKKGQFDGWQEYTQNVLLILIYRFFSIL